MRGRFPANLLVSGDVLNDGRVYETHQGTYRKRSEGTSVFNLGIGPFNKGRVLSKGNQGSFSRYFSLDEWWREIVRGFPPRFREYLEENGEG